MGHKGKDHLFGRNNPGASERQSGGAFDKILGSVTSVAGDALRKPDQTTIIESGGDLTVPLIVGAAVIGAVLLMK